MCWTLVFDYRYRVVGYNFGKPKSYFTNVGKLATQSLSTAGIQSLRSTRI